MNTPSTPSTAAMASSWSSAVAGLDLHQHADFGVGLAEITGHATVAAGARRYRYAANALRRIARRGDRALGLLDVLHIGEQQRLRADVEAALGQHRVVPGRTYDRRRRTALHRLELADQIGDFVGRMLGVEQDPVEAAVGNDLGGDVAAQAGPQPDLQFSGGECVLEGVAWHVRHITNVLKRIEWRCRRAARNRHAWCRLWRRTPRG